MGVEMHRQPGFVTQGVYQLARGLRPAHTRHVFEAEDVHAGGLEFARELQVRSEVVLARAVVNVCGVADRAFAQHAGFQHRVDRHPHVVDPVERIEHAEQVHALLGRLLHEIAHHVVGIVGVAHRVGRTQQHLQQHVGHGGAQLLQPLPRILAQKAHRHIRSLLQEVESKRLFVRGSEFQGLVQRFIGARPAQQRARSAPVWSRYCGLWRDCCAAPGCT